MRINEAWKISEAVPVKTKVTRKRVIVIRKKVVDSSVEAVDYKEIVAERIKINSEPVRIKIRIWGLVEKMINRKTVSYSNRIVIIRLETSDINGVLWIGCSLIICFVSV